MVPSDEFLAFLAQARAGNKEALGRLMKYCEMILRHKAQRMVPLVLQAKIGGSDLLQDTFVAATQLFPGFRGRSFEELVAWLAQILMNKARDATRRYLDTQKRDVRREAPLRGAELAGV